MQFSPETLEMLKTFAAVATAFAAVIAMVAVGKQEWRRPQDMWARRVVLAVLACVAMTHALSPDALPEIAQQFALCALLIVIAVGSRPRSNWLRNPDRR
jgi:hypothetical protein